MLGIAKRKLNRLIWLALSHWLLTASMRQLSSLWKMLELEARLRDLKATRTPANLNETKLMDKATREARQQLERQANQCPLPFQTAEEMRMLEDLQLLLANLTRSLRR